MALKLWILAGRHATMIAVLTMLLGVFLTAVSYALNLHNVKFYGEFLEGALSAFSSDTIQYKQVGYAWAPNWALTGILLLPLVFFNLFLAIRAIETLLRDLVQSGMLRHRDFSVPDPNAVIQHWRHQARPWAWVGLIVVILSAVFVTFFDFFPVVIEWLVDGDFRSDILRTLNEEALLAHPTHEFDWSVAATFNDQVNPVICTTANVIFASAAYLFIPIVGTSIVFGAFIFLFVFCAFFSENMRHDLDLVLVPDLSSEDPRCGFERFEGFFHNIILAAIGTGAMAVAMHLQNVFLRSLKHETIIDMVFGNAIDLVNEMVDNGFLSAIPKIVDYLTSMRDVVDMTDLIVSLQTYAAAIVLIILGVIVFSFLWLWLRRTAVDGHLLYMNKPDLSDRDKDKLKQMKIWPVGWISLNRLLVIGAIIFLSMWFVNFVTLVLIYFSLKAPVYLLNAIRETVGWRQRSD